LTTIVSFCGFEVLQWIRGQPGVRNSAVIVLTSSDHIRDVNRAYTLGANSFLVKPLEFDNYVQLSKLISEYWMKSSKMAQALRAPPEPPQADRRPS
jgi:DNA-binding NarL/FixJ family response regulator